MLADFVTLTLISVHISIKAPVSIVVVTSTTLNREYAIGVDVLTAVAGRAATRRAGTAVHRSRGVLVAISPLGRALAGARGWVELAVRAAQHFGRRCLVRTRAVGPGAAGDALAARRVVARVAVGLVAAAAGAIAQAGAALAVLAAVRQIGGATDRDAVLVKPAFAADTRGADTRCAIVARARAVCVKRALDAATVGADLSGPATNVLAVYGLAGLAGALVALLQSFRAFAHVSVAALGATVSGRIADTRRAVNVFDTTDAGVRYLATVGGLCAPLEPAAALTF